MKSSSTDYICQTIDTGAATLDGLHVVLNAKTETGSVRLMLPTKELPRIFALMFGLLRDAQDAQAQSDGAKELAPAFEARQLNALATRNPSIVLLEVILQSDAPGLILQLPERELVAFATGILQAKGLLSSGQVGATH